MALTVSDNNSKRKWASVRIVCQLTQRGKEREKVGDYYIQVTFYTMPADHYSAQCIISSSLLITLIDSALCLTSCIVWTVWHSLINHLCLTFATKLVMNNKEKNRMTTWCALVPRSLSFQGYLLLIIIMHTWSSLVYFDLLYKSTLSMLILI